jgi:hypothetical protein
MLPIVLALSALSALSVALAFRVHTKARAAAAFRARRHLLMLRQIAELLDEPIDDIAPLLSITPHELHRWELTGVPTQRQAVVAELFRSTAAVRREFSPLITRRLLALRSRRAAECNVLETCLVDLSRRFSPRHIVVTTRR